MPGYSQPRELPLDGRHLRFAVTYLLLALEVVEAPLPVQVTKAFNNPRPGAYPTGVKLRSEAA